MDETPVDFDQDPHPRNSPRSGCLPKAIGLLLLVSVLVGATVYFGVDFLKSHFFNALHSAEKPTATVPMEPTPVLDEPPALVLARQMMAQSDKEQLMMASQIATTEGSKIEAIHFLADSFPTASPWGKKNITNTLGLLAINQPEALPPVINALQDKDARRDAMDALAVMGPAAKEAIGPLKKIAANTKESTAVRQAARKTLARIQGTKISISKTKGKRTSRKKKKRK